MLRIQLVNISDVISWVNVFALTLLVLCALDADSSASALVTELEVAKEDAPGLVFVEGRRESVKLRNILEGTDSPVKGDCPLANISARGEGHILGLILVDVHVLPQGG
jgi:hypothetical protein